jgi:hypothetical protein
MPSSTRQGPPAPTRLAVSAAEARARIAARIELADTMLRTTTISTSQEFEIFKGEVRRWSDVTYQLLRRLFDSDEFASSFFYARVSYRSMGGYADFNKEHEGLRDQVRKLQTILDYIDVLEEIPEPVRPTPTPASHTPSRPGTVVNVTNSTVGNLNLGEIRGSVENKINSLPPSAGEFKTGLQRLVDAVAADQNLNDEQRTDALEHLESLADAGKLEPAERKKAIIGSLVSGLSRVLTIAGQAHDVWQQWQPTISGYLGTGQTHPF